MNLIALGKNPKLALRTSFSTVNVHRFIIFICEEKNAPSSNKKNGRHIQVPRVIDMMLYSYQTTKFNKIKGSH